jgi:uncharacterized protein (DUF2252 family)
MNRKTGSDYAKPEERLKQGRTARQRLGRKSVAKIRARKRSFDPIELLLSKTEDRIRRLLPVKYGRMAASPFAFFRGAVAIMAADLAAHPHSNLRVQLCGDAHVRNMGCFASPDGRIIFDLNDFDETISGPWEWDVKRMATSLVLAGRESGHNKSQCTAAVECFVGAYCNLMEKLADLPVLEAARYQIHRVKKAGPVYDALKQAERANPADLLLKYAEEQPKGGAKFKKVKDLVWPIAGERRSAVLHSLKLYQESLGPERRHVFSFFRPRDVAFKIVGTGSIGLRDYIILMEGNGLKDPLFLQFKQETASAYELCLKSPPVDSQGRRVVEGQRRIQPLSDPLLGWTRIDGFDYLVRQLNDHKSSVNLEKLEAEGLSSLAEIAGELLARGHARSGDPLALKGYIGRPNRVVNAIVEFALKYAEQTEADFEEFANAIKKGRVKVR